MRLREYSENIPKPMVPLGYRPILWNIMRYYAHYGHKDFILCLGYKADSIKNYFIQYDEYVSNDFVMKHGGNQVDGDVILLKDGGEITRCSIDAGADDVVSEDDGSIEVITSPESYADVLQAMKAADLTPEASEITQRASLQVDMDVETGEKVLRFLDALEDLDDTQDVYSNANIPEEAYN